MPVGRVREVSNHLVDGQRVSSVPTEPFRVGQVACRTDDGPTLRLGSAERVGQCDVESVRIHARRYGRRIFELSDASTGRSPFERREHSPIVADHPGDTVIPRAPGLPPVNGLTVRGRGAFSTGDDVLVVADLHLGRDESSNVSFPLGERDDLLDRLDALIAHFDPRTVVFAGDVVHTFDDVSERSRDELDELADVCRSAGASLELVAGNHDASLETAWDGPTHDEYVVGGATEGDDDPRTVVCHGHEPPETSADRYLIGHVHPTIEIEGDRRPCFLLGPETYRGADVLVLPAFNRLAPGAVVNDMDAAAFGSPLVTDPDRLEPLVYDDAAQETLRFPPLGELRGLL